MLRRFVVVVVIAVVLAVGVSSQHRVAARTAQETPTTVAPFDGNETEATIDRVRVTLVAIAAVTGALLVVYIWHTNPRRRMTVAIRRREDRELERIEALDETFVLPGELDGTDEDVGEHAGQPDESSAVD